VYELLTLPMRDGVGVSKTFYEVNTLLLNG